jgi:excisionase family DNA binding protein
MLLSYHWLSLKIRKPIGKEISIMALAERWLSVDEIADHLGVASITVYRWLEKEKIPAHRVGKLWRFKATEVDEWVQDGDAKELPGRKKIEKAPRKGSK